ncbi:MAG: hypothetical protein ACKO2L_02660 [Planctomycetaceae bacterium]
MNYKQLFLLILTIWSAELLTRLLFDYLLTPRMQYMTYYLETDKDGTFLGANIRAEVGQQGWEMVSAVANPANKEEIVLFFQRRAPF